jgi:hypothetical protein
VAQTTGVSTRRLIVAALLCGLAILIAGVMLLLRTPSLDEVPDELPTTTELHQP